MLQLSFPIRLLGVMTLAVALTVLTPRPAFASCIETGDGGHSCCIDHDDGGITCCSWDSQDRFYGCATCGGPHQC